MTKNNRRGWKTAKIRSPRPAANLFLLLALAVSAGGAHAQSELERGLARVHSVELEGVESLDEGSIKKVLKTRTKRWWKFWQQPPLLRQDFVRSDTRAIELFYAREGYLDASVTYEIVRDEGSNRASVIFVVTEGGRSYLRELTLTPVASFRREELTDELALQVGQPFNPVQVPIDRERLLEIFADRGRFPTIQGSWARDSTEVSLQFEIDEGPRYDIGTIEITGLADVDTPVVERELYLREHEMFRRSRLQRSIEGLYGTGLFQVVDVAPSEIDTVEAIVDLDVRLRERKHKRLEGGVGFGTADGIRVLAAWSNSNLWGKAHRLSAQSAVWFGGLGRYNNRIAYTDPWLFGSRLAGRISFFLNQERVDFRGSPFDERSWGGAVSLQREFNRRMRFTFSIENKWSEALSVPEGDLQDFNQNLFTSRFVLEPLYDDRDNKFDARRGQLYWLVAEFAAKALGSEGDFQKGTMTGAWHFPTSPRASLSMRVQIGRIWPFADVENALADVPASDIYRTGGSNSVRGYREQDIDGVQGIGGLLLLVSNVEYRFPLFGPLSGAMFLDGGNVWSRPSAFQFDDVVPGEPGSTLGPNDYRWSVGGGVRYGSPVGPIRLDLGYRLYRDETELLSGQQRSRVALHLSFGQPF